MKNNPVSVLLAFIGGLIGGVLLAFFWVLNICLILLKSIGKTLMNGLKRLFKTSKKSTKLILN